MVINGKEINFEYTIGAFCDFSDYCAANPEVSLIRANIYKAVAMNKAYCEIHGGEAITIEEIMKMPQSDYMKLMEAVREAEKAGERRTVETRNTKKKDSR